MPPKRQYSRYLWDSSADVPLRSKHRFKQNYSVAGPSASAFTPGSNEEGSDVSSEASSEDTALASTKPVVDGTTGSADCSEGDTTACEEVDFESSERVQTISEASSEEMESEADSISDCDHSSSQQEPSDDWKSELDQVLFPGAKVTRAESYLMIMAHTLRHGCSKEATESLLQLIAAHLPQGTEYPTSKYTFFQHFSGAEKLYSEHYFCNTCTEYLGELVETAQVSCPNCQTDCSPAELKKLSSFFLVLDLKTRLRELLTSRDLRRNPTAFSYDVADITQSMHYYKFPLAQGDITLTFNTDGVPLYQSSKVSMWPLLVMVNEFSYKQRVQNLLWLSCGSAVKNQT
ncbi:uncharacterized protein LOC144102659 [Amblyomma americanum]